MSFVTDDLVFLQNTPFIFIFILFYYFIGNHKMSFVTDDFLGLEPAASVFDLVPRTTRARASMTK